MKCCDLRADVQSFAPRPLFRSRCEVETLPFFCLFVTQLSLIPRLLHLVARFIYTFFLIYAPRITTRPTSFPSTELSRREEDAS